MHEQIGFLPLIASYAAVNYEIVPGLSLIKKNEPLIVADAPFMAETGKPVPVLLIIRDADKYEVKLESVNITVNYSDGELQRLSFSEHDLEGRVIKKAYWFKIVHIPIKQGYTETVFLDVEFNGFFYSRKSKSVFKYKQITKKKRFYCRNDNYWSTSHYPLRVYITESALLHEPGWFAGDLHHHSCFTEDAGEFGAPLEAIREMARALGFTWTAITDHSYDLDDSREDFTVYDPFLPRWDEFIKEITNFNTIENGNFVFIPGEEISCSNSNGKSIHVLGLGISEYIHGSGDSAERVVINLKCEHTLQQVVSMINQRKGVAVAAHPGAGIAGGIFAKILIRRGRWGRQDVNVKGLNGYQIWNGESSDHSFRRGFDRWRKFLLKGEKKFIFAGNDSHGDFNRTRYLKIPLVTLRESFTLNVFGVVRTYLHCGRDFSLKTLIEAIKNGAATISNGPFLEIKVRDRAGKEYIQGNEVAGSDTINIKAKTNSFFGNIRDIKLIYGDLQNSKEHIFFQDNGKKGSEFEIKKDISELNMGYLRGEVFTEKGKKAFTNPVWIRK